MIAISPKLKAPANRMLPIFIMASPVANWAKSRPADAAHVADDRPVGSNVPIAAAIVSVNSVDGLFVSRAVKVPVALTNASPDEFRTYCPLSDRLALLKLAPFFATTRTLNVSLPQALPLLLRASVEKSVGLKNSESPLTVAAPNNPVNALS